MISFCKNQCIIQRSYSKDSNAERIVKIFKLEAELKLPLQNNEGTLKQIFA